MIAHLSGEVAVRRADHVVISCGGVGYRLAVSAETLRHVPRVGEETALFTHLVVRDDALALYGFATEDERDLFLLLIGVQSVGPKMALAVLSGGTPRDLLAAVAALELQARYRVTPAALAFGLRALEDPEVAGSLRRLARLRGAGPGPVTALDFETAKARRLLRLAS